MTSTYPLYFDMNGDKIKFEVERSGYVSGKAMCEEN